MQSPGVVFWFRMYAGSLLAVYVLIAFMGGVFLMAPDAVIDPSAHSRSLPTDPEAAAFMGWVYLLAGALLAGMFLVSLFTPRRSWSWVYNLVMIALGMTSCICIPASIPLLIFWIKPEVRAWYAARGDGT